MIKTYLLVWNPAKWTFQDWPQALADMAQQGFYVRQWSCVNSHVVPGDTVLLKKTGNGIKGIIASGVALSVPYSNRHWGRGKEDRGKQYIQVKFDRLADYTKGEIFPVNDKIDFGFVPQASGCVLDEGRATDLIRRFHDYVVAPVIVEPVIVPAERKRIGLSIRLRYEILDRDAHTCRYCGRSSPAVMLHVDHVISQESWRTRFGSLTTTQVIEGVEYEGVNDRKNLVASCQDCNLGKSGKDGNPPVTLRWPPGTDRKHS
jgi:HNH endonuclease